MSDITINKELPLTLFADSGSTKTDWCLVSGRQPVFSCHTQGINPAHQTEEQIRNILVRELLMQFRANVAELWHESRGNVDVRFYGAGCRGEAAKSLKAILVGCLSVADGKVFVDSDLMAAAHALCGGEEGIACILGTGANSCLFDGEKIVSNISPLGYILGDEGSGAVLGKLFLNAVFKGGLPKTLCEEFFESTNLDLDDIIRRVYKEPLANRFLASLSPFIYKHLDVPELEAIVVENFKAFFVKNVDRYERKDLKVNVVGSVAHYYEKQLVEAARQCGYTVGKIIKSPMEGLVANVLK